MPPMYLPNYRKIVDGTDTDIEQALMGNMAVEDLLAKWADKFEQANRDYQQKKIIMDDVKFTFFTVKQLSCIILID